MRLSHFRAGALVALTSNIANAQFPPKPEGLKVLESRFGDGVQISYKEVRYNHLPTSSPTIASQWQAWSLKMLRDDGSTSRALEYPIDRLLTSL